MNTTSITCISDTHSQCPRVNPIGDVLIHSGDLTGKGTKDQVKAALAWLASHPHKTKILVPGNHDFWFQEEPSEARAACHEYGIILLIDESHREHGLNFYGSPWQPWFYDWAFNLQRGSQIRDKWDQIPRDTDVLITHGPPFMVLDETPHSGEMIGCKDLLDAVKEIRPKVHVFGHAHACHGITMLPSFPTMFLNATMCNEQYQAIHPSITVHL